MPHSIADFRHCTKRLPLLGLTISLVSKIFSIGHIGGQEIAFTNSSAYMLVLVAVISLLMIGG